MKVLSGDFSFTPNEFGAYSIVKKHFEKILIGKCRNDCGRIKFTVR